MKAVSINYVRECLRYSESCGHLFGRSVRESTLKLPEVALHGTRNTRAARQAINGLPGEGE